mgnify:CR=1 FL=1
MDVNFFGSRELLAMWYGGRTRDYTDLALFKNDASSSTPLNGIFETLYKVMARSNWVIKSLLDKGEKNSSYTRRNTKLG